MSTKEKLKTEVAALYSEGIGILKKEADKKQKGEKDPSFTIEIAYQAWYSKACPVVQVILPERYTEFLELYQIAKRKEIDFVTYTIKDYLLGLQVTRGAYKEEVVKPFVAFVAKFQQQLFILKSALDRIESRLSDIAGVLQSEIFDSEIEAAEELLMKNHLRAAGVLAGVTLESHLKQVCAVHKVKLSKSNPTIGDYNDSLKQAGIFDVPIWRLVQRLGDIRNLCAHAKDREPREDEVQDMIVGTRKVLAEIS